MINKPQNWDETNEQIGQQSKWPTSGPYVVVIRNAVVEKSSGGYDMILMLLDIAEGQFRGYYQKRYDKTQRWDCIYRQIIEGQNGNSTRYFKGMIKSIEDSNPGFIWSWDEKLLIGKKVGCMMRSEEYINKVGELKTVLLPNFLAPIDKIMSMEIPAVKKLNTQK